MFHQLQHFSRSGIFRRYGGFNHRKPVRIDESCQNRTPRFNKTRNTLSRHRRGVKRTSAFDQYPVKRNLLSRFYEDQRTDRNIFRGYNVRVIPFMMMPAAALFGMIMRMFVFMLAIAFFMFVMMFMAMFVSAFAVFRMGMVMFTLFVPAFAHLGVNVLMAVMVVIMFMPTAIVRIAVPCFKIGRITVEPDKFGA